MNCAAESMGKRKKRQYVKRHHLYQYVTYIVLGISTVMSSTWNFFFISMFFKLKSMLTISLDVIQDRSHLLVYKIADKAIVTRHNQVKWNRIVEEI